MMKILMKENVELMKVAHFLLCWFRIIEIDKRIKDEQHRRKRMGSTLNENSNFVLYKE